MILFLDDEAQSSLFLEELHEIGLPVQAFQSVDPALEFVESGLEPLLIAVVDVMMPTGNSLSLEETNDGLLTGVFVLERIRTKHSNCIIYLLTNLSSPELSERVKHDPKVYIRVKTDVFYDEFAEEIREVFERLSAEHEKGNF